MTERVVNYWQTPTRPGFASYMINQTGLNDKQQKMAWDLRNFTGDTMFYADRAGMPIKRYNDAIAGVDRHMMAELIRLAQIGWDAEMNRPN